jgi:hypothetical protein
MVGALPEGAVPGAPSVVDPATQAIFPFEVSYSQGLLTLLNQAGPRVDVINAAIPFQSFRIGVRLTDTGDASAAAELTGSAVCNAIPFYGPALQTLGLCNPQTDRLSFFGAANFARHGDGLQVAPAGVGSVTFAIDKKTVSAALSGSSLNLSEHLAAILLVDAATGLPVPLDYGYSTIRGASDGKLATVSIPVTGQTLPTQVRAYLMIDTYPAAMQLLTPPAP